MQEILEFALAERIMINPLHKSDTYLHNTQDIMVYHNGNI